MKSGLISIHKIGAVAIGALSLLLSESAFAAKSPKSSSFNAIEATKITAETQIRNLIEPILNKYCSEECKLMSVDAVIDLAIAEEISPGFDDVDPRAQDELAPVSAQV